MADPLEGAKVGGTPKVRAALAEQVRVLQGLLSGTMSSLQHRNIYDAIQLITQAEKSLKQSE